MYVFYIGRQCTLLLTHHVRILYRKAVYTIKMTYHVRILYRKAVYTNTDPPCTYFIQEGSVHVLLTHHVRILYRKAVYTITDPHGGSVIRTLPLYRKAVYSITDPPCTYFI